LTDTNSSSIHRVLDEQIQSSVIEIGSSDTTKDAGAGDAMADALIHTWLRCPAPSVAASLHIRLPQLIVQLKPSLRAHCSLEVQVEDHMHARRRLRISSFQRATVVHERITLMPMQLYHNEWNQLQLDLPTLVREAYGTRYVHTVAVCIHAHCRVRRIFFADEMRAEEALPVEFRLFRRLTKQQIAQLKAEDH
jgi:hypothetical protein